MNHLKTIVLTWTERRAFLPSYGTPNAALWAAEGTDAELNDALAYAVAENRRYGADYRVHTFATDDREWKINAKIAHLPCSKYAV